MTETSDESDIAVVFRTNGKSVRLTGPAKWRRAIMLRDLTRTTVVSLEVDGLNQGEIAAQEIDVLKPLFDEIDPVPTQPALASPPESPASAPAPTSPEPANDAVTNRESASVLRAVAPWVVPAASPPTPVPLATKPAAPVRAVAPPGVKITPEATKPAPTTGKTGAGPWVLVIMVVICLVLIVRSCNTKPATTAPADQPPYPITAFASPIQETVLAHRLNVHQGPGVGYAKLDPLDVGTAITAYGSTTAQDGGVWQYVQTPAGQRGYVNAKLVGRAAQ